MDLSAGETKRIDPAQPSNTADDNYVILGDSRDGYETFGKIIEQVNALNPAFMMDKVDTVYLSHIHSYFDYTKNGVRYIISGGAGF